MCKSSKIALISVEQSHLIIYLIHSTEHVCSPECPGGCWGPGADMCQMCKLNIIDCNEQSCINWLLLLFSLTSNTNYNNQSPDDD